MKIPEPKKLPSGSFRLQISISLPDGTKKRKSITGPTKEYVRKEYAQYKLGIKKEKALSASGITLSQAIDKYIDDNQIRLSPATVRGYRIIQRNRIDNLKSMPVSDITLAILQKQIKADAKTLSAKTIRNVYGFLVTIIAAETGEHLAPALPSYEPKEKAFLDFAQIAIFTGAILGESVEIPALLALWSLRESEIKALDWKSIDLVKRVIRVEQSTVQDEHNQYVLKPQMKTKKSRRVIPITDQLYNALSAVEKKEGRVVTVTGATIRNNINRICREHGLPEVGIHGLRHSFASLCHHLGIPEADAMEIGGWSDPGTMRKIYTHVSQRDVEHFSKQLLCFYDGSNGENAHENAHVSVQP